MSMGPLECYKFILSSFSSFNAACFATGSILKDSLVYQRTVILKLCNIMKLDSEPSYNDFVDHVAKVNPDSNKHFPSSIFKLYGRGRKVEDVMFDSIEGKVCQSIDVSHSRNCLNGFSLPSNSYPVKSCKHVSNHRDFPCLNGTSGIKLIAQEDLLYMDESVTDVKQLQLPVLTSVSTCEDICGVENMQSFLKALSEHDKVDEDIFTSLNIPQFNDSVMLMEETSKKQNSEGLKSLSTNRGIHSLAEILQRDVEDGESLSPSKCTTNLNETTDKTLKTDLSFFLVNEFPVEQQYSCNLVTERNRLDTTERTTCEEIIEPISHFIEEFEAGSSQMDSSCHIENAAENEVRRQNIDQFADDEELISMVSEDKDLFEDEKTSTFFYNASNMIDNTNVSSDHVKLHDVAPDSDLESRDISIGDMKKVMNNQLSMQFQNELGDEEIVCDDTFEARTSFAHLIHGNANLLEPSTFSGSLTNSSHVPYSGSISFQSEGSSVHSFAFPILQQEWSNSPVKMAESNRRHLRKHRLKTILICCKF